LPSTIEQIHQEYKDQGLTILAINLGEDKDDLAAWVKRRNVTAMVLLDPNGDVARSYAIAYTPTVFLIDRDGRLVAKSVGVRAWTSDKGRAVLRALIAR
jgi:cytochrome c biogenesis protein CcmG/thiol:disulfide interchange protein DsbE